MEMYHINKSFKIKGLNSIISDTVEKVYETVSLIDLNSSNEDNYKDFIYSLSNINKSIEHEKDILYNILSRVDLELQDLEHIIEFTTFDACKGYKLAKMIKDKREERRNIKNKMQMLDNMTGVINEDIIKKALKARDSIIEHKPYEPKFFDVESI